MCNKTIEIKRLEETITTLTIKLNDATEGFSNWQLIAQTNRMMLSYLLLTIKEINPQMTDKQRNIIDIVYNHLKEHPNV